MSVVDLMARAVGLERVKAAAGAPTLVETPWAWPLWRQGQPDWTPPTLQGFAEAGYGDNAIVFACIAAKAQSAALAPLVAYTGQRAKPERLPDAHPLSSLLLKPNPWQSWYEFMELLITYLELDGNAFIWQAPATALRSAQDAVPAGLFPLRSDRVRPVPGRTREQPLLGYVYDPADQGAWSREPYLPDEIIHVKYPNPADPFEGLGRGTSPLGAAAKPVDVDNATTSFLKNFFDNAVAPFGLLKSKQHLVDTEVKRIRERLRAQYGGVQNWGDVMILDADAEYQRLGLSMQEMTFSDLDFRNEARICMVLRVPPIIVGARVGLERSTFANYAEARSAFWEDSLVPGIYRRFEDGFNAGLSSGAEHWLAYDYSNVPALREDEKGKWATATRAFLGGLVTRSEARALVNLSPVPPEEDGFRAANEQQIGVLAITQTPPQVTGRQGGGKSEDPFGSVTPDDGTLGGWNVAELKQGDAGGLRLRLGIEARWLPRIARALRAQLRAALPQGMTLAEAAGAEGRLAQASPPVRDVLYGLLREAALAGLAAGAADVDGVLGKGRPTTDDQRPEEKLEIGIDWTLINAEVLEWVQRYSFELVRLLDERSRVVLSQAIQRWASNGLPLSDLIEELGPIFGGKRAALIAATEVTRAYAEANLAAWRASGVIEGVSWRTANDERVCPICSALGGVTWGADGAAPSSIAEQEAEALVVGIGQPFVHPGGRGAQERYAGKQFENPPAHPGCRCWLVSVSIR
jgi:HK97 family phage portal protein